GQADKSVSAAGINGVSEREIQGYAGATSGTKVPWQVVAAVRKTAEDAAAESGAPDTEVPEPPKPPSSYPPQQEKKPGQQDPQPGTADSGQGGPVAGEGWAGVDMSKAPAALKKLVKTGDVAGTIEWFVNRLALHVDGYKATEVELDAGADSNGLDLRYINSNDGDLAGTAAHVRDIWTGALKTLPLAGNPERSEEVFNLAQTWALGNYELECPPGVQQVSTGGGSSGWANPADGSVSSEFGMRFHPTRHEWSLHDGTDIGAPAGAPVFAAGSGTVKVVHEEWSSYTMANLVVIDHGDGIVTKYGHMSKVTVTDGQQVGAGEQVGEVGSEGYSTGPHLHFMVERGEEPIDPVPFMNDQGIRLGETKAGKVAGSGAGSGAVPAGTSSGAGQLPQSWTATAATGEEITLDRVQLGFAAEAVAKGSGMGVSDDALIIMLMTPFPEGGWQNYASTVYPETIGHEYPKGAIGSDHDSVGLWQQRPQSGWGTPTQLLDPAYGASAFLGGPKGPNGGSPMGLLDHPGWESMSKGEAAQDVQVSAFPGKYAPWEDAAAELLNLVRGKAGIAQTSGNPMCGPQNASDVEGSYTVASFNALGAHHSAPGGKNAGLAPGAQRMRDALGKLNAQNVTVVGLQEMENIQAETITGTGEWEVHRATPNNRFRDGNTMFNAIAWRKDAWTKVSTDELKVRYQSRWLHLPIVTLQNTSGETVTVMNVHNPSNEKGGNKSQWRKRARQAELRKIKKLQSQGASVLLTGDMNEKRPSFCGLVPASGGAGCNPDRWGGVDFIFADKDLNLANWNVDQSTNGNESDHPLVTATIGSGVDTNRAIQWAIKQVGKGYSQAQNLRLGPTHYDCSGLVYRAFQKIGIELPMTSITQSQVGEQVSKEELQPGDLIFYYSPVSHVSIYIGERNGVPSVVHAANPSTGVEIAPLSEMEDDIVGIRRVSKADSQQKV
ncbi:MAG: peptidoglycan DD-metalloendopeptidase family protein, partial [Nocardioides sp.]|nr:peptidoglycan DD-metalloendopeptidase family protein [Nocardioides sp.]